MSVVGFPESLKSSMEKHPGHRSGNHVEIVVILLIVQITNVRDDEGVKQIADVIGMTLGLNPKSKCRCRHFRLGCSDEVPGVSGVSKPRSLTSQRLVKGQCGPGGGSQTPNI